MPYTSWQQAVEALQYAFPKTTAEQLDLAARAGVVVDRTAPSAVTAQVLRAALQAPLGLTGSAEPSDAQLEYLADLCKAVRRRVPRSRSLATKALVGAWIDALHAERAIRALRRLRPQPGDIIEKMDDRSHRGELSSISADGRLNLRGGMGAGVRPHAARVVVRARDADGQAERQRIRNLVALRRTELGAEQPSGPQMRELERWSVRGAPEAADIHEFEAALELAADERPLQAVLTAHPRLLGVLLSGTWGNAVRPWPRLDGRLVPDFALAEADSAGIHWTFVELESPRVRMLLRDGRLAAKAREGVSQIQTWRTYLGDHVARARMAEADGGLGFSGLRPHKARGLVVVGRRDAHVGIPQQERNALASDSLILVRSYDWLLDLLWQGPVAGLRPLHSELRNAGVDLEDLAWN